MAPGVLLGRPHLISLHDRGLRSAAPRGSAQHLIGKKQAATSCSPAALQVEHSLSSSRHAFASTAAQESVRAQASGDAVASGAAFGPRGAFLVGFTAKDGADVAAWFGSVEPGFPVSHCSHDLLPLSLGEVLYADYCDPLADLVKPSADTESRSDGTNVQSTAASSAASSRGSTAPGPEIRVPTSSSSGSADARTIGGHRHKGGGMRPVGSDNPEPRRFRVHAYTQLLPMPRIAILSGLSEMEWVGICELWDTTGLPQPIFASVTQRMLTIPLGSLLDRVADEYARNDAVSASGPPPSVIDVERVRSKLEHLKTRKAAAAAATAPLGAAAGEQQPANQQQAARARAALDKRLASSGGRLQVVDFTSGAKQQGRAAGRQSTSGQPAQADAEAQQEEERFAALRRKAGKLARQERRTIAAKGDAAPQPRGFS